EIDAALAHIARDLTGIEPLGQIDRRAPAHAATGQLRDDLSQGSVQVSAHDVVIAANAMAELTGDVAVLLRPPGEAPHLSGGNRRQVERVLARVEPERDDAVVRTDAAPELHRLVVAAEGDVAEAVAVVGGNRVGPIDRPDGGRLEQLRQLGGERRHARPARRFAADVDHDAAPVRDPRKFLDETLHVLPAEATGPGP